MEVKDTTSTSENTFKHWCFQCFGGGGGETEKNFSEVIMSAIKMLNPSTFTYSMTSTSLLEKRSKTASPHEAESALNYQRNNVINLQMSIIIIISCKP